MRTTFWYVLAASTAVLVVGVAFAQQISWLLFDTRSHDGLVIAAFVGLWAAMNYEQMTSLFRVEQRSTAYVVATLANVAITIAATVLLVVAFDKGPVGVLVGNFTGTLVVYAALLVYSRHALGLQFDRTALPRDEPLRPAARPVGGRALADELQRPLLPRQADGRARGRPLLDRRARRLRRSCCC